MSKKGVFQDFTERAMVREIALRQRLEVLLAKWGVNDAPVLVEVIIGDPDIQAGLCAVSMVEVFNGKKEDFQKAQAQAG